VPHVPHTFKWHLGATTSVRLTGDFCGWGHGYEMVKEEAGAGTKPVFTAVVDLVPGGCARQDCWVLCVVCTVQGVVPPLQNTTDKASVV
jgi:hypothetical protein